MWVNGASVLSNAISENQKSKHDLNIFTIKTTEIVAANVQSGIFLEKQKKAQFTGNKTFCFALWVRVLMVLKIHQEC